MTDTAQMPRGGATAVAPLCMPRLPSPLLPERHEVVEGIWRLPLPLHDSPLGHVNAYLIRSGEGCVLVDCGWDTADSLRALEGHLRALGMRFGDIRDIVVTHIHPDHYGLAGRLREIANANLRFHRVEELAVESRYANADELLGEMREWLRLNGAPSSDLDRLSRASTSMLDRVQIAFPDSVLDGGEEINCGEFTLRVVWTPGHSAGHICLYEPLRKVLFSGDHVLPNSSPSVGLHARAIGNPLADYLDALEQVKRLDARVVLPGHGDPFTDLPGRVNQLLDHHAQRLDEMERLLTPVGCTAYDMASHMCWSQGRDWPDLSGYEQRLAIMEALAHLELLHAQHRVAKRFTSGMAWYGAVERSDGAVDGDPLALLRRDGRRAGRADHEVRR